MTPRSLGTLVSVADDSSTADVFDRGWIFEVRHMGVPRQYMLFSASKARHEQLAQHGQKRHIQCTPGDGNGNFNLIYTLPGVQVVSARRFVNIIA